MRESAGQRPPPLARVYPPARRSLPNVAADLTTCERSEGRGKEIRCWEGSGLWSDISRGSCANRVHALNETRGRHGNGRARMESRDRERVYWQFVEEVWMEVAVKTLRLDVACAAVTSTVRVMLMGLLQHRVIVR